MADLSKPDWLEIRKTTGNQCQICRRSKSAFPGIKLVPDHDHTKKLRGVLCTVCKKAVDAWPEPSLMFQAIVYLRGGV